MQRKTVFQDGARMSIILGLIIFLFGILLRGIPGFYVDETMWIREGETRSIPGAEGYYLESKEFIIENYTKDEADEVFGDALERVGMIAKNYQTDVALYQKCGRWTSRAI